MRFEDSSYWSSRKKNTFCKTTQKEWPLKRGTKISKDYENKETNKRNYFQEGEVNSAKGCSAKECNKDRNHTFRTHTFRTDARYSLLFYCSVMSNSLWPHSLQHSRLPYPSPSPRAWSNSCPSSQWCHPTISSSVIPFSSCLQSFPASRSFLRSCLFTPGGQSIGASASASVLPMNIQDWFPLGLTGLISLLSRDSQGTLLAVQGSSPSYSHHR